MRRSIPVLSNSRTTSLATYIVCFLSAAAVATQSEYLTDKNNNNTTTIGAEAFQNLNLNLIVDGPGSSSAFDVHIVPICVQSRLETVHWGCVDNMLWQTIPVWNHSVTEEILLYMQSSPWYKQFHVVTSECADCWRQLELCQQYLCHSISCKPRWDPHASVSACLLYTSPSPRD